MQGSFPHLVEPELDDSLEREVVALVVKRRADLLHQHVPVPWFCFLGLRFKGLVCRIQGSG
jgi:hypothetical protein